MTRTRDQLHKDLPRYQELSRLAGALSSPLRLEIIESLAQQPRSVEVLADVCGLGVKTVSHHLQKLLAVGLVHREARGREAIYSLRDPEVVKLWAELWAFMAGRADAAPGPEATAPSVETEDLLAMMAAGEVVILDVRPESEFAAGHLPGSRPMPLPTVPELMDGLPRDKTIVAVCRGPFCRLADEAVLALRGQGREAYSYGGGIMEWLASGQAVERGE